MKSVEEGSTSPLYVVYDKETGRILHTHSHHTVEGGKPVSLTNKAVLAEVEDEDIARAGIAGRKSLAVASFTDKTDGDLANARIDPAKKTLVPRLTIQLKADRYEIEGDGKDKVKIEAHVLGPKGGTRKSFAGPLKFGTSRGRLSAKGGLVEAKSGKAAIELTSVPETVEVVRVWVRCPKGTCQTAVTELEFV